MTKPAESSAASAINTEIGSRICRACSAPLQHSVVDLGMHPLCESFLPPEKLNHMEPFFPLHVLVCDQCWLVQLGQYVSPEEIFTEYAYFSSYSDSWLDHAKRYCDAMKDRLALGPKSLVVEVASNDGYLLQWFVKLGVPVLGIEPAANVAKVAVQERNVPTMVRFFGRELARELVSQGKQADLIAGNNVLAQVPDLNDFVAGLAILLKPGGTVTIEYPHLARLFAENQFDTIYHEHFSYFSLLATEKIFAAHGLTVVDVEELPSHGGSLRVFAQRTDSKPSAPSARVLAVREDERRGQLTTLEGYQRFAEQVKETKRRLLEFLIATKRAGKTIAGYGAPGKGNTLLNYCGIRTDFLDFVVDRNPYKHGRFTPGTHIPIFSPEKLAEAKPDYILILPWNLKKEIAQQLNYTREWGAKLVVPIPTVTVLD
ncbi:MAG: class I SAM-dependent methyltransferase [Acidobacteriota bacterium]